LVERLAPATALHAAAIIAVAPLAVVFAAWSLISEPKSPVNLLEMKRTFASLRVAFTRGEPWFIGVFFFLYYLSPGLALG
jgi:hypothetical protein